jgi:hypothetical protein
MLLNAIHSSVFCPVYIVASESDYFHVSETRARAFVTDVV